ncbi:hypothetical protein [Peptacetobacter sp.]|uniref:hypothetical protein n=1 Tax=Peptacetobacter sp. TaxID=2991975 RepID=UPI00260543C5|nr:hypothetical protein [Peptacetobacter sp.]
MNTIIMLKRLFAICILCLASNMIVDKINKDLKLSKVMKRVLLIVFYIGVVALVTWLF